MHAARRTWRRLKRDVPRPSFDDARSLLRVATPVAIFAAWVAFGPLIVSAMHQVRADIGLAALLYLAVAIYLMARIFIVASRQVERGARPVPVDLKAGPDLTHLGRAGLGYRRGILADEFGGDVAVVAMTSLPEGATMSELRAAATELRAEVGPAYSTEHVHRHEAAHAVVAHALGGFVIGVTAYADHATTTWNSGLVNGRVAYANAAYARLVTSIAGHVVDHARDFTIPPSPQDVSEANTGITALLFGDTAPTDYHGAMTHDGLMAAAKVDAVRILAEHADVVEEIEAALRAKGGTLGLYELRTLLEPVKRGSGFRATTLEEQK